MTHRFRALRSTLLLLPLVTASWAAERRVALAGHVPPQLRSAAKVGAVGVEEPIKMSWVLQLDPSLLAETLEKLYGAGAPSKKHFLGSTEFAERFGVADKRKRLEDFARANGLVVDTEDNQPESLAIKVSGSAGAVQKALQVQMNRYRAANGRFFRSPESAPLVPEVLVPDLKAIVGLSDLARVVHPHYRFGRPITRATGMRANVASPPGITGGTGPAGSLAPQDIRRIYDLVSPTSNGTGQTVALFELDGFNPADFSIYESTFGLPAITVTPVSVDGFPNLCASQDCATQDPTRDTDMPEVALDIELVAAVAPGISKILVYEDTNTARGVFDAYDRIAADNTAAIVSSSWGSSELETDPSFLDAENQIFQRMAIQGQTVFAASGDEGADNGFSRPNVNDPPSQPYVTAVGGTSLSGSVASPVETTWNDGPSSASGGGVSDHWTRPNYQAGVPGVASTQFRNVPDVALNADPNSGYAIYVGGGSVNGGWFVVGGTSAAAPLWAGFTALSNQQSQALGNGVLGFANPLIYQQASGSLYNSLFTDITVGDNGFYAAGAGYDNVTGWGSFKGNALINSINGQLAIIARNTLLQSLSDVYAYPNPWDVRKSPPTVVTIANVPDGATIKVFTLSGYHIADLAAANGNATWDLKNSSGKGVASDLYLYFVSFGGKTFRGKIAVIK